MRSRLVLSIFVILAAALSGCDLVTEPEGPSPDDFEVKADTSEVRANDERASGETRQAMAPQDVTATLADARSGVTLSIEMPR